MNGWENFHDMGGFAVVGSGKVEIVPMPIEIRLRSARPRLAEPDITEDRFGDSGLIKTVRVPFRIVKATCTMRAETATRRLAHHGMSFGSIHTLVETHREHPELFHHYAEVFALARQWTPAHGESDRYSSRRGLFPLIEQDGEHARFKLATLTKDDHIEEGLVFVAVPVAEPAMFV